ncbi:uncharacterized protein LOC136036909 isoform X2 [Artemia franciscana]|uniref:uncharacterized protein LOC136036909 isoform X2 n=1 Tax=Artemia franciscana TaxID=6661 RepID=UPI0032DAFAAF
MMKIILVVCLIVFKGIVSQGIPVQQVADSGEKTSKRNLAYPIAPRMEDRTIRLMRFIAKEMRQVKQEMSEMMNFLSSKQDLILKDIRDMKMELTEVKSKQKENIERVNTELSKIIDEQEERANILERNIFGRLERTLIRTRERFDTLSKNLPETVAKSVSSSINTLKTECCREHKNISQIVLPAVMTLIPPIESFAVGTFKEFKEMKENLHQLSNTTSTRMSWLSTAITKVHESVQTGAEFIQNSLISALSDIQGTVVSEVKYSQYNTLMKFEEMLPFVGRNVSMTMTEVADKMEERIDGMIQDYKNEIIDSVTTHAKYRNETSDAMKEDRIKIIKNISGIRAEISKLSENLQNRIVESETELKYEIRLIENQLEKQFRECALPENW